MSRPIIYDDFTGFTFNGVHCSKFGLVRVSNGDRYEDDLVPDHSNEADDVPGGVGQYYWGEQIKEKKFSVDIAYDSVTENDKRAIKRWLHPDDKLHELIFDEKPYVKYFVKCTKNVTAKELCFNEDGRRIYKGEFDIEFTAFMPYGIERWRYLPNDTFVPNSVHEAEYGNIMEWAESSQLLLEGEYRNIDKFNGNYAKIYNPGDRETGFELQFTKTSSGIELNLQNETLSNDKAKFPTQYKLVTQGGLSEQWCIFTPERKMLSGTIDNVTLIDSDDNGYIDINYQNGYKFVSNVTGNIYDLYEIVTQDDKQLYINLYSNIKLKPNTQYEGLAANGTMYSFITTAVKQLTGQKYQISIRFINENLTQDRLEQKIYILPPSNSVINFGIKQTPSTVAKFLEGLNFTFTIPDGSSINPKYWTEAQKMLYLPCEVRIDSNKQLVQYREIIDSTQDLYDNWIGVSGVISEGNLFKIPISDFRDDWSTPQNYNYFAIEQDTSNNFGALSEITLKYSYLYI